MPHTPVQVWRKRLQEGRINLRTAFEHDRHAGKLLRGHSRLVDSILRDIWVQAALPEDICLIAVGGYGRGELYPHSDVDILILSPESTPDTLHTVESLVGIFWDIGLAIGHSVRTLSECLDEAKNDITIQTNLLEARWLAGYHQYFHDMNAAVYQALDPESFFIAKMKEQTLRHRQFNNTSHSLEPNIKESPGGLRDLHNIQWIARSLGLQPTWKSLTQVGLISASEARQISQQEKLLQHLRIQLHYLAGRQEDRLLFDHQDTLARQIFVLNEGDVSITTPSKNRKRPSERIMHRYYQSARIIGLMNEIVIGTLKEHIFKTADLPVSVINHHFQVRDHLLEARDENLFEQYPDTILKIFSILQSHSDIQGISPKTTRMLWQAKKLVNPVFRKSRNNQQVFLQILHAPNVMTALRRMHRYGILGRYIPAFGRITDQMQHDLFHVYTVDEHTLNVLNNIYRFSLAEQSHEFPLCSRLFAKFKQPELLYLAAIFHDIAKGRGGDHSTLGAVDARRFCQKHGLEPAQTDIVAWLVNRHLTMSATAQQQDISDPNVIACFAEIVGDERHLTALYLLTVADIRGTSPTVWNAWKARLLESLYHSTLRQLRHPEQSVMVEIISRQKEAQLILGHYGIAQAAYQPLWKYLDDSYFLRHEAKEIAWQTRLLLVHANTKKPIVRARLSPNGDGIQLMIYTRDKDDLFANICGFFERMGYNIVEAKINTSKHGYALDSFLVLDSSDRSIKYGNLIAHIERELETKLAESSPLQPPLEGRLSRQLKHNPFATKVSIQADNKMHRYSLSLVAGDRPGLLSKVAHVLLKHNVQLVSAKINTMGNRAEDTLIITSRKSAQLTEQTAQAIADDLIKAL